ncbi:MAG: hypothetical protein K6A80_03670 [Saccharofermentans sp.]|nr:hypothetical protein [Saccharofermentans sp.]
MNKLTKTTIATLVLALIALGASYGLEIATLALIGVLNAPVLLIGALIVGAVIIALVFAIFALINRKTKWLVAEESALAMWLGATVYIIAIIAVFMVIPVPYSLIPRGEMAFGMLQFLMQLFFCGGAGAGWLFGCVRFLYLKSKK